MSGFFSYVDAYMYGKKENNMIVYNKFNDRHCYTTLAHRYVILKQDVPHYKDNHIVDIIEGINCNRTTEMSILYEK